MKAAMMNLFSLEAPADTDRYSKRPRSWKTAVVLGAVLFSGVFGLSLLIQKTISDNGAGRSAVMSITDPGYRVQLLEKAVSRYPGNAEGWRQLGHTYSESGQNALAAAAYEHYLAINPHSPDTWTKLGTQYAQTGRPEKALEAFEQALALNPRHEASLLHQGAVLLNAFNDLRGAIRVWMQVMEANPDAQAPDGRPIQEWIKYCQAASSTETSGAGGHAD